MQWNVQGFVTLVKGLEPMLRGRAKGMYTQVGHIIKLLWANTALRLLKELQHGWVSDGLGTAHLHRTLALPRGLGRET